MSLPRDESNTDRADAIRRSELRPVSTIAVQDATTRERVSQTLVNEEIENEQREIGIHPTILPTQTLQSSSIDYVMSTMLVWGL